MDILDLRARRWVPRHPKPRLLKLSEGRNLKQVRLLTPFNENIASLLVGVLIPFFVLWCRLGMGPHMYFARRFPPHFPAVVARCMTGRGAVCVFFFAVKGSGERP